MDEQYLQRLYDWISSQDPTFVDDFSYYDFAYNMQNNEYYAGRMYNWIGGIDNTFKSNMTKTEFKEKVASSELGFMDLIQETQRKREEAEQQAQQQAQQQEEQPVVEEQSVVEEPKKKGLFESLGEQARAEGIATASASTSEEQPSSSDSQETDDLSSFEQSISETSLESLERYRGDLERSTNLNDVGLAKLEIVKKEIARREEEKAREGETELERSERLQREIEQTFNIPPATEQPQDQSPPITFEEGIQDRGTAFTPTIQTPSEDVTQEAADIKFAGQEAAKEAEVERYKENQQLARELNQDEGVENFQVETVSTDIGARYDFGSKTFVQTDDKTYLAYPEGMTLEQARQEGKLMEFSTEEQAKYFAEGGWEKDDEYMGSFLGDTPIDRGDPFERRLDAITKDLIDKEESLVVPEMQYLFEGTGFKFEQTNTLLQGADAMRVTAPNGQEIVIDLDPSSIGYINLIKGLGKGDIEAREASKLRSFMRMNQTEESKEQFELAMEQDKNKLKILREDEIAGTISQFNMEFENAAKEGAALNDMYESIEAQSERFSNITEADLRANPALMAEYNQYVANVDAFNAKSTELAAKETEIEARGKQIDALAGAYFDMKEYQGTFLGRYRNELFTGIGKILAAGKRIAMTQLDGGAYSFRGSERKDDVFRYAFNMIENNPEDLYFDTEHMETMDGIGEGLKGMFGDSEDGLRAKEIITSGKTMSKEDANFLRTFLEGQREYDAKVILNLLRVKGTKMHKPSYMPDAVFYATEANALDAGLGTVSHEAVTDAYIQYKENYSKTRTKQEAFDRFFETGSIRLPANPYSQVANRDFDRGQSDVLRESFNEAFNFAFDETATEESIAKKLTDGNIFERVSLGVTRSVPAMALTMVNPIAGGAGMVLQSMDDINVEMDNNPAFDDVSEREKLGISTLYGGTIGVLENVGFRNLRYMKGFTNGLLLKAIRKAPKGASVKTLQQIVAQDIKSATARGGITLLGAGLAEFETGAAQQLADIGIKTIYNEMKEKEMFYDVADNALDVISQAAVAGFEEMLGGFMLGSIPATQAALTKQQLAGVDDATFQAYMEMVKDPEGKKLYVAKLKQQILESKGKDRKKLEDELDMYNKVQGIINKMPDKNYVNGIPTDYTTQQKKVALQLLLEKQELMSSKEGKSPELTKSQQNRINEIDTQLEAIGTKAQQDLEARQEAEAAIPDISQKEEQQKQQDMYDKAVTEQEKRDVEEMFGVPEGEMEGRKGPNIFMNKKGERTSDITAEQEVTRGRVIEMASKAAKAISKVIPNTNIVLYETTAEFQNATGRQGRGFFGFDGTVHINLEQATETTVAHEVMHAVLFDKFGSKDPNDTQQIAMAKAATQMVSSVRKTIDAGSELAKRLDSFASKYEAGVQNEEQLSELFGIMAAEYTSLKPRSRSAIVNFFKDIAKRFGIDLGPKFGQNDADVVQLMNTLSRKVRTGETIVEEDVTALDDISVLKDTAPNSGEGVALQINPNNTTPQKVDGRESKSLYAKFDGYGELPVTTLKEFVDMVKGQLFAVTSDATKVGKDSKGNPIDGGFGNLAHEKNVKDGVGFSSTNITAISGSIQKIMNQYPAGTKVGVMVMIQNPTATIGNQYGGRYLHRVLMAVKESDPDGYADFVKDINDYVDSKSDLAAYRDSKGDFFALLDKPEGISEVEFGLQFAKSAGFELSRPFMKSIIPETAKIGTKKSLNGSINKRIQDLGFNQLDFLMEYGDVELLGEENILGTNEIGTRLNDKGGNVVGGFIITVPTKAEKQKFIDDAQKKGFNHPQFSVRWGSEGNFIFDGLYNIDDNFMRFGKPQKVLDKSKFTVEQRDAAVREQYTNDKNYLTKHRSKPLSERTYTHLTIESKGEFKRDNPEMFIDEYKSIAPGIAQGKGVVFETLPTSETEYTKTGRRQMGEFESKSPIDEFGDIDDYAMEQAYDLANSRGIRIGRLKELSNVVTNAEGNIVGATFTEYDDGVYSFDIVVDESVEGQGVGTLLLEDAMYPPFEIQYMDPNVKTRIKVVNPVMQSMLENRGFRVTKKVGPDNVIMEPAPVRGREQRSYPLEDISLWYGESNYKSTGGKLIYMTPKQFIGLAKPLKMDEETRENVDDLKAHIEDGKKLDPLTLYGTDRTNVRDSDGRHRAIASMELGIQEVPVVDFTGQTIGREQKEAPSQKYDDNVALRIIKENNALDNPMSTGAIEYLLVERYKFPLKKVRDMMTVNLDLFDTLPKSFANIKGGKTAGIKLYNRVQAFKQKLIENNSRRTKLTDAEIDAEVAKYRASLNDGRKLTEEQITAQTKSYMESLTKLSEQEIQAEVNEFRESLEKANKRRVVKGVLITGRNSLTPAQIDAEVQAYENALRDRNAGKPDLTRKERQQMGEQFLDDLYKKNNRKPDRMKLEEMQEKTAAFKDKLVKKNNKRKAKLTEEEIMDKTIEYLQAQPEYKAEGKGKSNRLTIQQASMLSQLQKQVGIRPSQNIGRKIQKARTMVSESVRTRRNLQKAKASIRNFLRKTLPQSVYTTEEVLELINDITLATDENIEAVFAKVEEFVINKNTKILEAEIKAILEGKYEKTESGRRKAKGISLEVNKRIQYIKSKIVPKGSKLEEFQMREARLRAELQELNNKEVLTEEEQNRAVDVIIALQLNAANEMVTEQEGITDMNAASIKLDYLDNIADTLRSMIADGKSQLKDELKAEKERLNRDKTDAYEDITGNRIDFNSKGSKQKLDDETFGREQDEIAAKVSERIVRFFRNIGRGIELIFVSAEALDGLMDKISKLPGEMFGGRMQELVTNKIDDSSLAFKARMMEQEAIIRDKFKELYGKNWVSKARSHSIVKETNIKARGRNLKLSQNQMYYLYNMYKDPANKASFRTMYGSDYKRVMAEIEANLEPEVKAFADWQVNEYFPSLYNHYNEVYKRIYKTNMPLNQFYAGRIYRKNVDPQPIDLLGSAPMANNFISASSIKERVNNNAAIEAMNGTDALYSYLNEMEYFAAYAENVRDINRIFKDPNIKDAIEKINGKAVYKLIDGAINTIANRGGQRTLMDRFVNAVTSTFVVARIAISPVIMIKQLTSMVTYMNDIGIANYMLYSAKNLVSLKSTMKEIYDNSVYVKDRKNESIFRVLESYNDNAMKKFIPNKVRTGATWFTNFLMFNTKFGDMTAILMGGSPNYSYYKAQAIKQGKTEEQAIKIAIRKFERDTKRTQQSQDLQDKDYFQNAGAATRFMGLFQTAPKQYLRKEIQAVRQLGRRMRGKGGKGTMFENFRTLMMYHVVAPTLFQYVAIGMPGLLRDWREDEDYPDLIRAMVLGNLNSLIVFGEILNWGGDYATGKPWAGETTRALPLLSTLQKVIIQQKKIDETSPDKEYYQDMIDKRNAELLTLLGIPAPTLKKFYDNYGDGIDWNDPRDAVMKLLGYSEFQIKGSEAITGDKPRNIFDEDFRKQSKGEEEKKKNKPLRRR